MTRALDPDVRLLQAAADPTRLAIIRQLSGAEAVCACDFTACCDVAQPTVSHHLRVLREAGWVTSERRGSWVHYRLHPDAVTRFGVLAEGLTGASGRETPARGSMPVPAGLPAVDQVTVYGADWCGDCRRAKRYLDQASTPYTWVDTATDERASAMLREAGYLAIPVVQLPGGTVLVEPSNDELAAALGARAGTALTGTAPA